MLNIINVILYLNYVLVNNIVLLIIQKIERLLKIVLLKWLSRINRKEDRLFQRKVKTIFRNIMQKYDFNKTSFLYYDHGLGGGELRLFSDKLVLKIDRDPRDKMYWFSLGPKDGKLFIYYIEHYLDLLSEDNHEFIDEILADKKQIDIFIHNFQLTDEQLAFYVELIDRYYDRFIAMFQEDV